MIELANPHVRALVAPLAAMLVDAVFLIDGREHRPLARAPWIDANGIGERGLDAHPGHLRVLGGDFVGLPFGASGAPAGLDAAWAGLIPDAAPDPVHGHAAEFEWSVLEQTADSVRLGIDYPLDSPIARLERTIGLRADAAAIDFQLDVIARATATVSVALHPILRLPDEPGELSIEVPFTTGFTYPGRIDPGLGPTAPWREFTSLSSIPARDGGVVDFSRVPLETPVQDNVLLAGVTGPVHARFADTGTHVTIEWDRALVPNLMLWLSDGVIDEEPWNGRYRGLGVEPLAAAFDFADSVSIAANPLTERGVRTAIDVATARPLVIRHSIAVEAS